MLRSVLGRRTGLEKPVVIDFDEHKRGADLTTHEDDVSSPQEITEDEKNISSFLGELKYLEKSLNGFSLEYFKEGAIKAYEMILIGHSEEKNSMRILRLPLTQEMNLHKNLNIVSLKLANCRLMT